MFTTTYVFIRRLNWSSLHSCASFLLSPLFYILTRQDLFDAFYSVFRLHDVLHDSASVCVRGRGCVFMCSISTSIKVRIFFHTHLSLPVLYSSAPFIILSDHIILPLTPHLKTFKPSFSQITNRPKFRNHHTELYSTRS